MGKHEQLVQEADYIGKNRSVVPGHQPWPQCIGAVLALPVHGSKSCGHTGLDLRGASALQGQFFRIVLGTCPNVAQPS